MRKAREAARNSREDYRRYILETDRGATRVLAAGSGSDARLRKSLRT
jgi:hypothetical protein